MKLIVGLGNPGEDYCMTRHNMGFMVTDEIARSAGKKFKKGFFSSEQLKMRIAGEEVVIIKPMTFMNESGRAVVSWCRHLDLHPGNLIIIHDDMDIPLGKIRIKTKGGDAGHKGVRSIIQHMGTENFIRIRAGIGRPPEGISSTDYVLGKFTEDELPIVIKTLRLCREAVETIITDGVEETMTRFNKT